MLQSGCFRGGGIPPHRSPGPHPRPLLGLSGRGPCAGPQPDSRRRDPSHGVAFFTPSLPARLLSRRLRSDDSALPRLRAQREGRGEERAGWAGRSQRDGEGKEEEGGKRVKGGRRKSGRAGREEGRSSWGGRSPSPRLLLWPAAVRLGGVWGPGESGGLGCEGRGGEAGRRIAEGVGLGRRREGRVLLRIHPPSPRPLWTLGS